MSNLNPPATLYKYYPPERLDIFDTWSIRFTHPSHFNDTFDTDYSVHDKRDVKARLRHKTLPGVFCVAEDPNNHLMWVNYSNQHRGFVVGFDTRDPFFSEDNGILRKVVYQQEPPQMTFTDDPPIDLCFFKSKDWAYEEEWRCVRQFRKESPNEAVLPHAAMTEFIMGWKMSDADRVQLLNMVESLQSDHRVTLSQSLPEPNTWTFIRQASRRHICDKCRGSGTVEPAQVPRE